MGQRFGGQFFFNSLFFLQGHKGIPSFSVVGIYRRVNINYIDISGEIVLFVRNRGCGVDENVETYTPLKSCPRSAPFSLPSTNMFSGMSRVKTPLGVIVVFGYDSGIVLTGP